jgi:predicted amidohydrolase YtcJ
MLIRNAILAAGRQVDIHCDGETIAAVAPHLPPRGGEVVIDADGGAVLPGLHDHHIHLLALAASLASLDCSAAANAAGLARLLSGASHPGQWLRAFNYHDSIAGAIDRAWLDRAVPNAPVRVQHRSGRLWILNSVAIAAVTGNGGTTPLEQVDGIPTGRLYDGDSWLREQLGAALPDLARVGRLLAEHGVTAVTDATPANDLAFFSVIDDAQIRGDLPQRVAVMGKLDIAHAPRTNRLFPLALKMHLHEGDYPAPDIFMDQAHAARAAGLGIAVHCVTEGDLIFTLSLLHEAGLARHARIEHASIVPPDLLPMLAASGITVVTQPNFVSERGDAYRHDIPIALHGHLYRGASLLAAGVQLGGGTDAPFGHWNPWAAMQAAVTRVTPSGETLGANERLSPEAALALFTTRLNDPGGVPRRVVEGQAADLCILAQPWSDARQNLANVTVRATVQGGRVIYQDNKKFGTGRKVA